GWAPGTFGGVSSDFTRRLAPMTTKLEDYLWEERWTGEVRVNLVRLIALAAFYIYHLLNYYFLTEPRPSLEYHLAVTAVVITWVALAAGLHLVLLQGWIHPVLPCVITLADIG